jgi:hypothetical protein
MQTTLDARTTQTPAAQIPAATATPRVALFTGIHKGLRACMMDALHRVGRTSADDATDVAMAIESVRGLVTLCQVHLHSENQFVHPAMEARRPGSSTHTADEHVAHEQAFGALLSDTQCVERSTGEGRATALAVLYQRLSLFVADNFEHMFEEETENQSVLWACYTDAELLALEGQIVASHTPEQSMLALRWMLPAMTPVERVALYGNARRGMPAGVFAGFLDFGVSLLGGTDGAALRAAFCSDERARTGWPA